jgi:spore coat protein H
MVFWNGWRTQARSGRQKRSVSLDKAEVDDNWPLIRYLLDDPVYYALYLDYVAETIAGPFDPDHIAQT